MTKNDFTVIIVGRENVGKSTLFNKLLGEPRAIVDDFPGVTRDKIYGTVEWTGKVFNLIDTGGILFNENDLIKKEVLNKINGVLKTADFALFVVDGKEGLNPYDKTIYEFLKKSGIEFSVVVNKIDTPDMENSIYEFYKLGVDKLYPVSAEHSIGLDSILDLITKKIKKITKKKETEKDEMIKITIAGRENVGKSSLFNALINEERSIVTEIPGTTRDSIDSVVEIAGKKFIIIDTAGIKKRKNISQKVEKYSIGRTFANIKRSDMVIYLIDAMESISEVDKKALNYALENYKGIIIAINKWDLVMEKKSNIEEMKGKYIEYIRKKLNFVDFAPVVFVSAKLKKGLEKLIDIVFYVENQYNFRVKTSMLNRIFSETIFKRTPISSDGQLKIYYITQVGVKPPEFAVFVNKKEKIKENYIKYIINSLRQSFGFEGVPLKINIKLKKKEGN
jgi:GTP-binding protein